MAKLSFAIFCITLLFKVPSCHSQLLEKAHKLLKEVINHIFTIL